MTRLVAAISLFAIEMQVATWSSLATITTLFFVNAAVALVAFITSQRRGGYVDVPLRSVSLAACAVLALLVLTLNVQLPLQAADPYHLARVAQIQRLGTLAYDPFVTDPKVNVLGWTYELLLADIGLIPLIGRTLLQVQGLLGIALYALAVAASRTWFPGGRDWCRAAVFVIPVVFHQFVLVKNDLFGAVPALVALAWLVARGRTAGAGEIAWASWLVGFAIGTKITSAPLAVVFTAALLVDRRDRLRALAIVAVGGFAGAVCAGLGFTMVENWRWYGHPLAVHEAGGTYNRNETLPQMLTSVVRFGISLFDLGTITRRVWAGRGGWGSTFGLPMVWALVMLALRCRGSEDARRALWIAGAYFVIVAAIYTDADIAHRLALAPGLLLIVAAISVSDGDDAVSRRMRQALGVAIGLSALQIARSAALYLAM